MNGIELSKAYYEQFGKPMLEERFPELLPYLACGVCGSGSESFGFDDEISRDHDLEPGFCIFLPGEDVVDRRSAFLLERAYASLPKEFHGLKRSLMAPAGGRREAGVLIPWAPPSKAGTSRLCPCHPPPPSHSPGPGLYP